MSIYGARFQTKTRRSEGRLFRGYATAGGLFAYVAWVREKRREQGQDEVKLMFTDLKEAHLNTKCDEELMGRIAGRVQEVWEVCQAEEMVIWTEQSIVQRR